MGLFNRWKKKRDRYYKEKKRQYQAISDKYGLGLKYEEYDPIAWKYADDKAQSSRGFFGSIFSGGNIFKTLVSVALAVVSVVFPPLSVASSSALMALVGVGAAVGLGATLYGMYAYDKMVGLALEAQKYASSTSALKAHLDAKMQKDALTHMLIFNPYEIFANGEIYKAQNAGSQSYSPSLEFDPAKGILGAYQKIESDELITTRAHTKEAGNIEYFSHTLAHEVPLKSASLPLESLLDGLENKRRINNQRITQGFLELNKLYFNVLGTAQRIYERVIKEQIEPIENYMIQSDFLERLKNYNKGLRADIQGLSKKDFKRKKSEKTQAEEIEMLKRISSVWNEFQTNENYTLKERALHYHDSVLWIYECLCAIKTKVKVYKIETYGIPTQAQLHYPSQEQKTLLENATRARDSQRATWSQYTIATKTQEAKRAMSKYNQEQKNIETNLTKIIPKRTMNEGGSWGRPLWSFSKIIPNVEIPQVGLKARLETISIYNNPFTQQVIKTQIPPIKELGITSVLKDMNAMSIQEAVEYYDRHLKARSVELAGKKYLVLDFGVESLGILELSAKDFAPLGYDLPKNAGLENFDWESLDGDDEDDEN